MQSTFLRSVRLSERIVIHGHYCHGCRKILPLTVFHAEEKRIAIDGPTGCAFQGLGTGPYGNPDVPKNFYGSRKILTKGPMWNFTSPWCNRLAILGKALHAVLFKLGTDYEVRTVSFLRLHL